MRFRFLAFGVIAGMLAACTSGSADGTSTPTPTPTPRHVPTSAVSSATPSAPRTGPQTTGPNVRPGEKPPVYPALAKKHTANGARALAMYFIAAFDWGYVALDSSLVQKVSTVDCAACHRYVDGILSVRRDGGHLSGGRVSLRSIQRATGTGTVSADIAFDVAVDESPVVEVLAKSRQTAQPAVRGHHFIIYLSWHAGSWKVANMGAA